MLSLVQDIRYSLRTLRKSPGFAVAARDPLVLAGVVFPMALVGLLATWLPARRALSVDPMILLREQ